MIHIFQQWNIEMCQQWKNVNHKSKSTETSEPGSHEFDSYKFGSHKFDKHKCDSRTFL
jgi:hypothetical protein